MNELIVKGGTSLTTGGLDASMFSRWVGYIDAKPKTIETYTRAIRQFAKYMADNRISQPTREDIIAYREYLKENHKPTTVQGYMAAVKVFFQWAEAEGLYPNVANRVKGVSVDRGYKKDYLTSNQTRRLFSNIDTSTLKGKRDYAVLSLMITTGLRTVSVVNANIEDMRTAGDAVVLYYKGKGHEEKAEYVKLAEPVEKAIAEYLRARGAEDQREPLFTSIANRNSGERMTTKSISRLAKENLVSAGLESDRLTAHSLRHTAATQNLLNGGTLEETQQLLGHSNINTTMIYAHALDRARNNSESRIAAALFG